MDGKQTLLEGVSVSEYFLCLHADAEILHSLAFWEGKKNMRGSGLVVLVVDS